MTLESQIAEALRPVIREELARTLGELRDTELLTTEQAAQELGVRPKTVRAWVRSGKLPRAGPGRRVLVRRADLERAQDGTKGAVAGVLETLEDGR